MKLRTFGLFATLTALAVPSPAAPSQGGPRVVSGGADIGQRPSVGVPWRPVAVGGEARIGWQLRCPNGCTVADADGSRLTLEAKAHILVLDQSFVRTDGRESAVRTSTYKLLDGHVAASVPRSGRGLVIESKGASLAVGRGGAARVSLKGGMVAFGAVEGGVHVRTESTRWTELRPGQAARVAGSAVSPPRELIGAPSWTVSGVGAGPIGLAPNHAEASVGGAWSRVAGAVGYRVQIARDAAFRDIFETIVTEPGVSSFATRAPIGGYFARVSAIDPDGLESVASPARQMRVVAVGLPAGGISDSAKRTLVLPEARPLRVEGGEGVELALDKPYFGSPNVDVHAVAAGTRRLWVRLKNDWSSATAFNVERRALHAQIEMTPHNARWPTDPIDITVKLEDPSGLEDPTSIEPELRVMVNLEEVRTTWTRSGTTWRAHLPPRKIGNNTVVRVIAVDEHKNQLGRAFLEIEPAPRKPSLVAAK
jgi:hypothetical protein